MLNEAETWFFSYGDESEFLDGSFALVNDYLCVIFRNQKTTLRMNVLASVGMSDVEWLRLVSRIQSNQCLPIVELVHLLPTVEAVDTHNCTCNAKNTEEELLVCRFSRLSNLLGEMSSVV